MTLSLLEGLWTSNIISGLFVIITATCWNHVIKEEGRLQFKISNVISLATNEWFLRLVVVALIGTMVTYYAQALIGVGKGSLFYHTGTVVLLVFAHYRLKERFTSKQLAGAGLILLGSVLVTI